MSKRDIEELAAQCRMLGWGVENTSKGFYRILPPHGDAIISPGTSNGRSLANFKAELRNAGFNPEGAQSAKIERAALAIAKDRKHNDAALERARRRSEELATAPTQPTTIATPHLATLSNPFAPPAIGGEEANPAQNFKILAGYPRQAVLIDQKGAAALLEKLEADREDCPQRSFYVNNAAKYQQAMELGEWELNPVDSLVTDEKGRLINGQHRMKALVKADPEFVNEFYPKGVPFYLTTGFPSAMAHIFDTGRARSASDALTVGGLSGWGQLAAGALRLAMHYDQSFEPGGVQAWPQWRSVQYTNTELVAAAEGPYGGILSYGTLASRAYSRSRATRSATLVAAFLIERDNPGGSGGRSNKAFWDGVCGDDDMKSGDPRMALVRFSMRSASRRNVDNGPHTLAHILRRYADYHLSRKVEVSQVNRELPMPPVWRPGMRWFGQELRYSKLS